MKNELIRLEWVRRAYDEPLKDAFSATVCDTAETMAEVQTLGGMTRERQMNVAEAVAAGYDLGKAKNFIALDLVDRINGLVQERDGLAAEKAELERQLNDATEDLLKQVGDLQAQLAAANAPSLEPV